MDSDSNTQVSVKKIKWNKDVDRHFEQARFNNHTISQKYYKECYKNDELSLFGLFFGDQHVASFVVTVIHGCNGDELHVHQAVSGSNNLKIFEIGLALIEQLAEKLGCISVAFACCRDGTLKKALDAGYYDAEIIVRRDIREKN